MTPEVWNLKPLWNHALGLPPADRRAFVEQVAAHNDELRAALMKLIQAEEETVSLCLPLPELARPLARARKFFHENEVLLARFRVVRFVGEGGMGEVYEAEDLRLGQIALKTIRPEKATAENLIRFDHEVRLARKITSPHVCRVHELFTVPATERRSSASFLSMQFLEGRTLARRIRDEGPLPLSEARSIAAQLCSALQAIHEAGVIHRDFKSNNVMLLSENGATHAVVMDLGLARETAQPFDAESGITIPGSVMGTPEYMAPEQFSGEPVTPATDIYGLGVVLYEMVTGRLPFGASRPLAAAILRGKQPPLPSSLRGELPPQWDQVISCCLEYDPGKRYRSAAEVAVKLSPRKRSTGMVSSIATVLAAIVAMAVGIAWFQLRATPEVALKAVPLTTLPNYESAPAFSPDGNQVAFMWNGERGDNYDIYVQLIGSGRPFRLTANPGLDCFPSFSPDGHSVAFLRKEPAGVWKLMSIPALGGGEREVSELGELEEAGGVGGWSADGRWLLISIQEPNMPYLLFRVSLENGTKQPVTSAVGSAPGDSYPAISPDGHSVAFNRKTKVGTDWSGDLFTLRLGADLSPQGTPKRLTSDDAGVLGTAWTADGKDLVFSSFRLGSVGLWRLAASGSGTTHRLSVGENAKSLAISTHASRLAYQQVKFDDANIWRLNLATPTARPAQFIGSTREDYDARYSPDGRKIAFKSDRSGHNEIWVCDADGSDPVQLTTTGNAGSAHWSPDGRRIAFDSIARGQWEVFVISANGGSAQQVTFGGGIRPSWTRDGQFLYYSQGSTPPELWKVRASGGPAVRVGKAQGFDALESADGRFLFYARQNVIWKSGVDGSGESRVVEGVEPFDLRADGIYYTGRSPDFDLRYFSFSTQKSHRLLKTDRPLWKYGLSVSPDGQWLLYSQGDGHAGSDLMLVEDFH